MVLGYLWITIVIVFETLMEHIKFFIPTKLLPKDDITGEIALVTGAGSTEFMVLHVHVLHW